MRFFLMKKDKNDEKYQKKPMEFSIGFSKGLSAEVINPE